MTQFTIGAYTVYPTLGKSMYIMSLVYNILI